MLKNLDSKLQVIYLGQYLFIVMIILPTKTTTTNVMFIVAFLKKSGFEQMFIEYLNMRTVKFHLYLYLNSIRIDIVR